MTSFDALMESYRKESEQKEALESLQQRLPLYNFYEEGTSEWRKKRKQQEYQVAQQPLELLMTWCLPLEISEGYTTGPCCTYNGCGGSDDGHGSTYTEYCAKARYEHCMLRTGTKMAAVENRRTILGALLRAANRDGNLRRQVIAYAPRIRTFLGRYKPS